MKLHELKSNDGTRKRSIRVGRGIGSGKGKTSGRGHKGQKARSGHGGGTRPGFEGGNLPLLIRLPKRGFKNIFATKYTTVNLSDLNERFADGDVVDVDTLKKSGLIKKSLDGIKILANGDLSKKLTVKATAFSAAAKEKIEELGGKAEVI